MKQSHGISTRSGLTGIEHGHIFFFYQPRECQPRTVNDVRMLYCLLHPFEARTCRLLTIDTKRFPDSGSDINYTTGHVTRVDEKEEVLQYLLRGSPDRAATAYRVANAPVRQCGDGVYTIAIKESRTFIAYLIETPKEEREIADHFGIKGESHYGLGIQNPWYNTNGRNDSLPAVPDSLRSSFDGDKIIYTMIPLLLNYERMQVIFIRTESFVQSLKNSDSRFFDIELLEELFEELELQKEKYPVGSMLKRE